MVRLTVDTSTGEVWRKHTRFPDYWVSSFGRVLSRRRVPEKVLVLTKNKDGYETVRVYDEKDKAHSILVHRLVAEEFFGFSAMEINHKDKNPSNNNIDNLEYCTRLENCKHRDQGKKRFVSFHKQVGKYFVQIANLTPRCRGWFLTKEEAYEFVYNEYYRHFGLEPWSKQ
jgi:hypothetical protein